MQEGKGAVQAALLLSKALACLMKQEGQAMTCSLWEGRCCPSQRAQGSSWRPWKVGIQCPVKDSNGTATSSFPMGLQGGNDDPVP